ncbi:MAG: ribonuclease III [Planctomycetaceae bacterium]
MTTGARDDEHPQTLDEKRAFAERALEHRFEDRELLHRCLTHSSVASVRLESNERLEFLGDAVLGLIVCEMLFREFPEEPEGELTRLKSALVSRQTCARITERMHLDRCLLLGKGLLAHDPIPSSINAAVFESLVAGVYLDGGMDAARTLIERVMEAELEAVTSQDQLRNFKSLLQQLAQKSCNEMPVYRLLDEKGPDHSKCFKVSAVVGSEVFPAAWGPNKKQAEQHAARNALLLLQGDETPGAAD